MSAADGPVGAVVGTWDVAVATPVGTLEIVYDLVEEAGRVTGTATSRRETVPVSDVVLAADDDGVRVTWGQTVAWPMRLVLRFDVVVDGDRLSGHSRAGRLPRSRVTGTRRRPVADGPP